MSSEPEHAQPLLEDDLLPDPLAQFAAWFTSAQASDEIRQPEAMAIASATPDGVPSVRMVLCKGFDESGFRFFTNYDSRKGFELAANPQAALLFYWEPLGRQVRVEGSVAPVSREVTERYARSRPRGSQLSALASPQSRPVESRAWLEERVAELAGRYADTDVPVPDRWGGFTLQPERYEFWQHRQDRLHDRVVYARDDAAATAWRIERLAP